MVTPTMADCWQMMQSDINIPEHCWNVTASPMPLYISNETTQGTDNNHSANNNSTYFPLYNGITTNGYSEDMNDSFTQTVMQTNEDLQMKDTALRKMSRYMDYYFVPCVIATGLVGNTLSFLVFVLTNLRRLSSSVYLAALAVSDNGFLLCVFFAWSYNINITIYHKSGWCQTFVYLTYVFGFLSVWYIVVFSCERFIAVRWPFKRSEICTPKKARIVVISLSIFALVAYSFAIWTSEVTIWYGFSMCIPKLKYRYLVSKMNNIDSVVTLVIPFIVILLLNSWIVYSVRNFASNQQQQQEQQEHWQFQNNKNNVNLGENEPRPHSSSSSSSNCAQFEADRRCACPKGNTNRHHHHHHHHLHHHHPAHNNNNNTLLHQRNYRGLLPRVNLSRTISTSSTCNSLYNTTGSRRQVRDTRRQSQLRVTKMLLVVSSIFLLLNFPSHVIRLYDFFQRLTNKSYTTSLVTIRLQNISQYIYYVNFAINFLLYNLCGRNFRKALVRLLRRFKANILKVCRKPTFDRNSFRSVKSFFTTTKF